MKHLERVQDLLCGLFTKVYKKSSDDLATLCQSILNKRFIVSSSNYWSSTTNMNNPSNAWNVNFNNGNDNNNNKTNDKYVRCVRDGA
ncbi:MAG TPA: DUF1566 domain-containing protein [Sulfurimonas sp.]|nr:DUF1566 domain-containing protein [Sulfurimonas sp.]